LISLLFNEVSILHTLKINPAKAGFINWANQLFNYTTRLATTNQSLGTYTTAPMQELG